MALRPLPFALPSPLNDGRDVVWTGDSFLVNGRRERVLAYGGGAGNWTDELTSFHEKVAGDEHYIDKASRRFAVDSVAANVRGTAPVVMDIGCSSGFLLTALRAALPEAIVVGADYIGGPFESLAPRLPGIPLLQFDLTRCPLQSNLLDGAVLLNVLEHIEDDRTAIEQVYRILKPGGIAVIELPAGPALYDIYDKQLMHLRRYRMRDLAAVVKGAGFRILQRSHLGCFLYPAFWLVKKRNQRYLNAPAEVQRAIVARNIQAHRHSGLLNALMDVERILRRYVYLPAGIRCLIVAQKPQTP